MDIFADDRDRLNYLQFMMEESERFGVTFLCWCLMSNHLIAVPEREESLARAIGEAHRRYTWMKNFIAGERGYLFQGRFNSCVLDQQHLLIAGLYVERNPVAANMVEKSQEYPWSSCRHHCGLIEHDPLIRESKLPAMVDDWARFLLATDEDTERNLRKKTRTGRPAGDDRFVLRLEVLSGRALRVKQPGRRLKLE
jgi:putative transposase